MVFRTRPPVAAISPTGPLPPGAHTYPTSDISLRGLPEPSSERQSAFGVAPPPGGYRGFYLGFPVYQTISAKAEPTLESILDYCFSLGLGEHPWANHIRLRSILRVSSVRIDDNRNQLCDMFLKRAEDDGSEVLVMLDRDQIFPADGVVQLVHTCTEALPIVCGVYFQRSLENPYAHIYKLDHVGMNYWGEESRHYAKLAEEVVAFLRKIQAPESVWAKETTFRLAQPDESPLPADVRLLNGVYGGTGFIAIHRTALQKMKDAGLPYYPWFRDRGEKGDIAFFGKAHELNLPTAVDLSVYSGHLGECIIGLPDFMRVYGQAAQIADDHRRTIPINRVAVVIPTLTPDRAAKLMADIQETAGIPVIGITLTDYPRRGGVRSLNDAIAAALATEAPAVLLCDDDIGVRESGDGWLRQLADALEPPMVGAVGPSIACRGPQGVDFPGTPAYGQPVTVDPDNMPFLVGACMLYKRAALMQAGQQEPALRHYHADTLHAITLRAAQWKLRWLRDIKIAHDIAGTGFFPEMWEADRVVFERRLAEMGVDAGVSVSKAAAA